MAANGCLYIIERRMRIPREQRRTAHYHAWRAEAALHSIVFNECRLHGMKLVAFAQSFNRRHGSLADIAP